MDWQVIVVALVILVALFLIARKGGCCSAKGMEKKDSESEKPPSR